MSPKSVLRGMVPLLLTMLACEPMIAIGRYELLFLIVLIAVLLGPPLYRFIRSVERFLRNEKKDQ